MLFQGQILNYPNINLQTVKDKQTQLKITLLPVFIYLFIYPTNLALNTIVQGVTFFH